MWQKSGFLISEFKFNHIPMPKTKLLALTLLCAASLNTQTVSAQTSTAKQTSTTTKATSSPAKPTTSPAPTASKTTSSTTSKATSSVASKTTSSSAAKPLKAAPANQTVAKSAESTAKTAVNLLKEKQAVTDLPREMIVPYTPKLIDVTDQTIRLGGGKKEELMFGFAAGDKIV